MSLYRLRVALVAAFCTLSLLLIPLSAQTFPIKKRKKNIPGQHAIVFDERLSALRTQPHLKAPLISRLRRDREVGILGPLRSTSAGPQFYPVAISRNVRGWIIADALARPQRSPDAARLLHLMESAKDDFVRARLARLCADQYAGTAWAPRALLLLGQSAEQAAKRLSRDARNRVGEFEREPRDKILRPRDFLLNYVGLDRYNRLGITFDYDEATEQFLYDGAAYREILKKYPRSPEAPAAQQRLGR